MRTQLLHVVPAIDHEQDCDTAANDDAIDSTPIAVRPELNLTAAPGPLQQEPREIRNASAADDEYWLGGYAGI